jgi:hypothetical protein
MAPKKLTPFILVRQTQACHAAKKRLRAEAGSLFSDGISASYC